MAASTENAIILDTIDRLTAMTDCRLSGDDSILQNVWEEVCVQAQAEHSVYWDAYIETIESLLVQAVNALTPVERQNLWLRTDNGEEWEGENDVSEGAGADIAKPPVYLDDIVDYLKDRLLTTAYDYENVNIRDYLEGVSDDEDEDEDEGEDGADEDEDEHQQ